MIRPVNLDAVEAAYNRLNKTLDVGEALLLCNYIEPLIAEVRELRAVITDLLNHLPDSGYEGRGDES